MPKQILLLLSVTLILFSSCGKKSQEKPQETQKKLPLVKVRDVTTSSFTESFKVIGVVKPFATAKLSSEEGGLILSIRKNKGDYVRKGEIVVQLKKDVETATYEQMVSQLELTRLNYDKQEELWKDKATTEMQYLSAKLQYEAAEKGLSILRTRLTKQFVHSPISGVVDDKYMNKGEMSAPGVPILNIIDIFTVKISAGIPERYVTEIKKGQSVSINIDVLPGVEFEGKISYISPALSPASRTFEIEVVINNKDKILKPEMNANILIAQVQNDEAIVISQDLVVDYGEEKYVYVLEGDIARKKVIELGGREGNLVLVLNGLNTGDKIIYEGFQSISEGEKVEVVK
jgi:membrane fusion protein, multidrug efflux system